MRSAAAVRAAGSVVGWIAVISEHLWLVGAWFTTCPPAPVKLFIHILNASATYPGSSDAAMQTLHKTGAALSPGGGDVGAAINTQAYSAAPPRFPDAARDLRQSAARDGWRRV